MQEKFSLLIDNIPLTQLKSSKFLGIYVDEHLTWNEHINNNISIKMAKSIRVIFRIAYLLSDIRLNLIHPYLSYCNIVWPSNYTSRLKRLSVLQRRLSELWQEDPLPPILIINFMTFGFWSLSKLISCKLVNYVPLHQKPTSICFFRLLF